jgi:hypothetical protein
VTNDSHFLSIAEETAAWFIQSGMVDPATTLVVDGLTTDCVPTGDEWTYNSGILLQAFSSLYKVTGNQTYATYAKTCANAAIRRFQSKEAPGILADDCCSTAEACDCSADAASFHGILARSLGKFLTVFPDEEDIADAVRVNAASAWNNRDYATDQLGISWWSPVIVDEDFDGDKNLECVAQMAGLHLLNANKTIP